MNTRNKLRVMGESAGYLLLLCSHRCAHTPTQRDRQTNRHTHKVRHTEGEIDRHTYRERKGEGRERQTHRRTEIDTHTQRERQTDIQRERQIDTHKKKQRERYRQTQTERQTHTYIHTPDTHTEKRGGGLEGEGEGEMLTPLGMPDSSTLRSASQVS